MFGWFFCTSHSLAVLLAGMWENVDILRVIANMGEDEIKNSFCGMLKNCVSQSTN